MTSKERELITDLKKCNFNEINEYFKRKSEERKSMTKEQKAVGQWLIIPTVLRIIFQQEIKAQNEEILKEYGFCVIDHHRQKIGNFRIEPPGLFRGRGDHPKRGMLKKRVVPEDVIINCSK
jgi:DNA topoisomerase-1